jgi:hypothetical protein
MAFPEGVGLVVIASSYEKTVNEKEFADFLEGEDPNG